MLTNTQRTKYIRAHIFTISHYDIDAKQAKKGSIDMTKKPFDSAYYLS